MSLTEKMDVSCWRGRNIFASVVNSLYNSFFVLAFIASEFKMIVELFITLLLLLNKFYFNINLNIYKN